MVEVVEKQLPNHSKKGRSDSTTTSSDAGITAATLRKSTLVLTRAILASTTRWLIALGGLPISPCSYSNSREVLFKQSHQQAPLRRYSKSALFSSFNDEMPSISDNTDEIAKSMLT